MLRTKITILVRMYNSCFSINIDALINFQKVYKVFSRNLISTMHIFVDIYAIGKKRPFFSNLMCSYVVVTQED